MNDALFSDPLGDRTSSTSKELDPSLQVSSKPSDLGALKRTLAEVIDAPPQTRTEWGRVQRAAKDLAEVGATPEQVVAAAEAYRFEWPNVDLTANALAANWSRFSGARRVRQYPGLSDRQEYESNEAVSLAEYRERQEGQ